MRRTRRVGRALALIAVCVYLAWLALMGWEALAVGFGVFVVWIAA